MEKTVTPLPLKVKEPRLKGEHTSKVDWWTSDNLGFSHQAETEGVFR